MGKEKEVLTLSLVVEERGKRRLKEKEKKRSLNTIFLPFISVFSPASALSSSTTTVQYSVE